MSFEPQNTLKDPKTDIKGDTWKLRLAEEVCINPIWDTQGVSDDSR